LSGGETGPDSTRWQFWWELNKDPYLDLRRSLRKLSVHTADPEWFLGVGQHEQARDGLAPSAEIIRDKVAPRLLALLRDERSIDIRSGAIIALARIGEVRRENGVGVTARALLAYLTDPNQEVAETATLSLGILGDPANAPLLIALARGDRERIAALGVHDVAAPAMRTRAFATFGLGLLARRMDESERQPISDTLFALVSPAPREATNRDLKVAALVALANCELPRDATVDASTKDVPATPRTREAQVLRLLAFFADGSIPPLVRAHVPRTAARLLEPYPSEHWLKQRCAQALVDALDPHGKEGADVQRACTQALGQIGDCDLDEIDQRIRTALVDARKELADLQTRYFALISLAQVGSREGHGEGGAFAALADRTDGPREVLLGALGRGVSADRAWAALALGVLEHSLAKARGPVSTQTTDALRAAFEERQSPDEVGALAIALGLARDERAVEMLLDRLENVQDFDAKGYVAIGLGLIGDRRAIEPIDSVLKRSRYHADLLRSAATALGVLGDGQAVPRMVEMLAAASSLSSQAALAAGLGAIGDARSIDPLLALTQDPQKVGCARGLAAAALGIVADKDEFAWRTSIAVDLDYRAATETLSSPSTGTGVLDLL